jgi:putative transposase
LDGVLTDLKSRGVEEVLICCEDGFKGFPEVIKTVLPRAQEQTCIIHQICHSKRYIVEKDNKELMKELQFLYLVKGKEEAHFNILALEEKWTHKYTVSVKSWLSS